MLVPVHRAWGRCMGMVVSATTVPVQRPADGTWPCGQGQGQQRLQHQPYDPKLSRAKGPGTAVMESWALHDPVYARHAALDAWQHPVRTPFAALSPCTPLQHSSPHPTQPRPRISGMLSFRCTPQMSKTFRTFFVQGLLASWLAWAHVEALAHDTWFQVRATASPPALWLGTGDRFPVLESRLEVEHLKRHGCARHADLATRGAAAGRPLVPVSGPAGRQPNALTLRLPGAATTEPVSCWASLVPFDIEIEPAKIEPYLKEIAAGQALRDAWAAEQAAGRPWRERFVKHARVEIGGASAVSLGLPMEAVPMGTATPKVREETRFQLLYGGRPLVDHPVELVSDLSKVGLWRRTDGQGQIVLALPLAGNWLLRSTLLRPPAQAGERWQSDFVTLAFTVDAAPR